MLLGISLNVGGVLALFWAQGLHEVLAWRFLSGVGSALWTISRLADIADLIQTGQRGRSIAILGGLGRVGTFVGPALGGVVGATFGLRMPFLVFAGLGLLCIIVVLIWVKVDLVRC